MKFEIYNFEFQQQSNKILTNITGTPCIWNLKTTPKANLLPPQFQSIRVFFIFFINVKIDTYTKRLISIRLHTLIDLCLWFLTVGEITAHAHIRCALGMCRFDFWKIIGDDAEAYSEGRALQISCQNRNFPFQLKSKKVDSLFDQIRTFPFSAYLLFSHF